MPNQITVLGLETQTQQELIDYFTAGYESIYGNDINLDSASPDGQYMLIQIQAILDVLDFITNVNSGFDPDQAIGVILDQRVAINGIQRQGGSFTLTDITLIVDRALNLAGLDGAVNDPNGTGYTVADNAGNNWVLVDSQSISVAGTYVFSFRAQNTGAVLTVPNTITVPVTVVLGVTSINNPTTYSSLGVNQETDAQLRIRRQKSTSLSSQGYLAGLLAALLNLTGVVDAFVYENNTGSTDADGIPGHSIWVIMQGGADSDIATAIYSKRNAGCGMRGSVTFVITQVDGSPFTVRWDIVVSEDVYIQFHAQSIDGVTSIDTAFIAAQLVLLLPTGVNQSLNINELSTLVNQIDPNCLVVPTVGDGFSLTAGSYQNILSPSAKNKKFAVTAPKITITVV